MVREIVRDENFLSLPSDEAAPSDRRVADDLVDTLRANLTRCVGMAANMIGVRKRIIAVAAGPLVFVMINPVILKKKGEYTTEEGCLSLDGMRKCTRYEEIEVGYLDSSWQRRKGSFSGFTAQIIQHEVDHTEGIVI